ncbi:MAG: nucleotide kinase [Euryarchaeota archaeon]|jgi:nucleoside-triphosphatase|nr:nucleotide kinase [Euryarchaeota archaeon]|tara:strand:- start:566 stop:1150 length:585 start_codon:yes stop_codon:yes gene_type:complete
MGIHPKIGITGLPRSGKSAVMQKVVSMLADERVEEMRARGDDVEAAKLLGGMRCEPLVEDGERVGFKCINYQTGEEAVMAHKNIDSRTRVLGYGIDPEALDRVAVPAIREAMEEYEVIVIDEIGKFSVESEAFVEIVRKAMEVDKPTLVTLHKKSRHPLLQDIRRRDDARILEVTPVNRALLPYKIHKLMRETY